MIAKRSTATLEILRRDLERELHVIGVFSLLCSQVCESVGPFGEASLAQPFGWPVRAEAEHQVLDLSPHLFHREAGCRGEETHRYRSQSELEQPAAARRLQV